MRAAEPPPPSWVGGRHRYRVGAQAPALQQAPHDCPLEPVHAGTAALPAVSACLWHPRTDCLDLKEHHGTSLMRPACKDDIENQSPETFRG